MYYMRHARTGRLISKTLPLLQGSGSRRRPPAHMQFRCSERCKRRQLQRAAPWQRPLRTWHACKRATCVPRFRAASVLLRTVSQCQAQRKFETGADVALQCVQTVRDAGKALSKQGVWCSRALWGQIQRTLEAKLDEASRLSLQSAQMRAAATQAHEQAAVEGLLNEQQAASRCRALERQVRLRPASPCRALARLAAKNLLLGLCQVPCSNGCH